jgi:membrane-bound metal-dependent hydrolase YbcI (DUF457 family)
MTRFSVLGAFLWLPFKSYHSAFLLLLSSTLDCLLDTSYPAFYNPLRQDAASTVEEEMWEWLPATIVGKPL